MIAAGVEILAIYQYVFWHALTVSFTAWILLPLGLLAPGKGRRSIVTLGQVFGGTVLAGLVIMAVGACHGGMVARTPDYVHGLACIFGVASAMALTWALGRTVRLALGSRSAAPHGAEQA